MVQYWNKAKSIEFSGGTYNQSEVRWKDIEAKVNCYKTKTVDSQAGATTERIPLEDYSQKVPVEISDGETKIANIKFDVNPLENKLSHRCALAIANADEQPF